MRWKVYWNLKRKQKYSPQIVPDAIKLYLPLKAKSAQNIDSERIFYEGTRRI